MDIRPVAAATADPRGTVSTRLQVSTGRVVVDLRVEPLRIVRGRIFAQVLVLGTVRRVDAQRRDKTLHRHNEPSGAVGSSGSREAREDWQSKPPGTCPRAAQNAGT